MFDDFFHRITNPGIWISGYKWADQSGWVSFFHTLDAVWLGIYSCCRITGHGIRPIGQKDDMGGSKGTEFWLHSNSGVISLCNIILLILSSVDSPQLPNGFSFFRCPFSITSRSRLYRLAQETFRKNIGYPGRQWDHDHSCGFPNPSGWICGFSSLKSDAINE